MLLPFLFAFGSCSGTSNTTVTVVVAICVIVLILAVIASIYVCNKKRLLCFQPDNTPSDGNDKINPETDDPDKTLSGNLMPPCFFTDGLKDPLKQPDLMEKINP